MLNRMVMMFAACVLSTTLVAQAAVVNGDYETGTLTGWATIGASHVDTSAMGVTPTQGIRHAYIDNTGNFASPIAPLVTFLGVPGASILALGEGSPTTGSAIKQSFSANAGDVLSFDWNFLTDEHNEGLPYNDFAIFSVDGTPFLLASRNSTFFTLNLVSPPAGFDGQTNYATQTYTFTTTGIHDLTYSIFNVGDAGHNSVLLVDDVKVSVPEPASLGVIMLGLGLMMRRRINLH